MPADDWDWVILGVLAVVLLLVALIARRHPKVP